MSERVACIFCFSALALSVAYGAFHSAFHPGRADPFDWNVSLLAVGLAGVVYAICVGHTAFPPNKCAELWAGLLFPAYVVFQLAPLPLVLLRILSPARAEIADAVGGITAESAFVPLTIGPSATSSYIPASAGYTLLFLLVADAAKRFRKSVWVPVFPLIVIGGLEAAWGFLQHSTEAVSGTYRDRNLFAGLLQMILPFSLMCSVAILYRGRKHGAFRIASAIMASVPLAVAGVIFVAIVLSFSKMGLVSTIVSLFIMGIVGLGATLTGRHRWFAFSALALLAILIFVLAPPSKLVEQLGSVAFDQTAEGRWPIAKDTLRLITAFPLFGSGLGTYSPALLRYQTSEFNLAWTLAHNDYLQILSELGVIGALIPAALMAAVLLKAVRTGLWSPTCEVRYLALACVGGLTAILIHSLTQFNAYFPANAMAWSWIAGLAASLPVAVRTEKGRRFLAGTSVPRNVVLVLGCLVTLYSGAWLVFLHSFKGNVQAERVFCRIGICDTDGVLALLAARHGGERASVPPSELRELLRRDPAGPARWCDLGESLQRRGDTAGAGYCFARALELAPHVPYILFRNARFQFASSQDRPALQSMAEALRGDPGYADAAFSAYEQRKLAVDDVTRDGLPPDPALWKLYLRRQIKLERISEAARVWTATVERGYVDNQLANEYIEFLMRSANPEAAVQAWALYAGGRSNGLEEGFPESNRVFNGDFEYDSTRCRFDWRIDPRQGTAIDFDPGVRHSGRRALRVRFDGTTNVADIGVWQEVFLESGRYRLRAFVRTEDVSTNEGVAFRVVYGDSPKLLDMTTETLKGSNEWTLVERVFDAPPKGGLVTVSLARKPSLKFDNLIRGTAWIDQVEITALDIF
jgi:O-antigen ligase